MDGELPRVFSDSVVKARKEHTCYECQRTINKGRKYHLSKGNWDGEWYTFKTCMPCHDLRTNLEDHGEWAPFGYLGEWAYEADEPFPPEPESCV